MLALSADAFNERSNTVIAMAVTIRPQRAGFPLTMPLNRTTLGKRSWVKLGQARTLSVERLGTRLGRAAREEVLVAIHGLRRILGE